MKKSRKLIIVLLVITFLIPIHLEIAAAQNGERLSRNICIVRRGDNLWRISRRHNVRFRKLLNMNQHLRNQDLLFPGNRVYIPKEADGPEDEETPPMREDVLPPEEPVEEETPTREPPIEEPEEDPAEEPVEDKITEFEREVVALVNEERRRIGLEPYSHNQNLSEVARTKSEDMRDNNYFSHQSPTYGSPFDMLNQFGIQYRTAGENIARGQRTPQEVVNSWMNSPGHRRNILSQEFTEIGVGFAQTERGDTFWTQLFIRP